MAAAVGEPAIPHAIQLKHEACVSDRNGVSWTQREALTYLDLAMGCQPRAAHEDHTNACQQEGPMSVTHFRAFLSPDRWQVDGELLVAGR